MAASPSYGLDSDAIRDEYGISHIANTVATCVDALIPHVLEGACEPSFTAVFGCGLSDFDYLALRCDPATFTGTWDGWSIRASDDMEGDWGRNRPFLITLQGRPPTVQPTSQRSPGSPSNAIKTGMIVIPNRNYSRE